MANLSVQMVNCIEGHRAWVSDKTLVALSNALGIEVFQLFTPGIKNKKQDRNLLPPRWLMKIKQDMKKDIDADVDMHFEKLLHLNTHD